MINTFGHLVFFAWIPFTVWLFWRTTTARATAFAALGAILLLPERLSFDLPALPELSKMTMPPFVIFVTLFFTRYRRLAEARPLRGVDGLFLLLCLGAIGTVLTNPDPLVAGPRFRQALTLYDALSMVVGDAATIYFPFVIGRVAFARAGESHHLVRIVAQLALLYSLVCIVEMRLSPQMHRWLYGAHPFGFLGAYRLGGYRPVGLTKHGLELTLIMLAGVLCAISCGRARMGRRIYGPYLWIVLLLCRSLGTMIYSFVVVPARYLGARAAVRVGALVALLIIAYPAVKASGVVPEQVLIDAATEIDVDRGRSLQMRFEQDGALIDRAMARPWFGWGWYDRNRILDPATGEDLVITDGHWTIVLGTRGLVGFLSIFGLLTWPIFRAWRMFGRVRDRADREMLAGLSLTTAAFALDLLPNGQWNYLPFFFAGALHASTSAMASSSRARPPGRVVRRGGTSVPREVPVKGTSASHGLRQQSGSASGRLAISGPGLAAAAARRIQCLPARDARES